MSDPQDALKVGLEVHRQLDTQHKLFCNCPTTLTEIAPEVKFLRKLRPTQSELGQFDRAALAEFRRGREIVYESDRQTSCLVESDEEPPSKLNSEAINICLTAALLMNARPVDEIHVMRKLVVDGSNTTGFQRTCVIAMNGTITVDGKVIPIDQISLEEDAARKTIQTLEITGYRIDRLGIPLIEITTAPVLESSVEVEKVALAIGNILRATRKVKRGLGSVRQDLNISTPDGALVEMKGVQELEILRKAVDLEVQRQRRLHDLKEELKSRGIRKEDLDRIYVDLTELFKDTRARVIKDALSRNGVVVGLKIPNFAGLIGRELVPGLRFGTEMSSYATVAVGVGGIFHSDELPAYGITQAEVDKVKEKLAMAPTDAFVLIADEPARAKGGLDAVADRTFMAVETIPEETRTAMPDGTSRFIRPRPGAARMYPETDVPPTPVTEQLILSLKSRLPETPEATMTKLQAKYSLHPKLAKQLVDSEYLELFEIIAAASTNIQPSFVATFLTETCKSLEREGVQVNEVRGDKIMKMFELVNSNTLTKETLPQLMRWQAKNPDGALNDGIQSLGLRILTDDELDDIIARHVSKNRKLVEEKGSAAFSSLMGSVMSEVRGRADPKIVAQKIGDKITEK